MQIMILTLERLQNISGIQRNPTDIVTQVPEDRSKERSQIKKKKKWDNKIMRRAGSKVQTKYF
jgi:hypothetical protein